MTNKLNVNLPVNGFFINLTNKHINKQKAFDYVVAVAKELIHPSDFESVDSIRRYSFLEVEKGGDAYALHQKSSLEETSIDVSFLFLEEEKEEEVTSESKHEFSNLPKDHFYVVISNKLDVEKLYEYLCSIKNTIKWARTLESLKEFKARVEDNNYIEISSYNNLFFLTNSDYLESGSKNITQHFLLEDTFKLPLSGEYRIKSTTPDEAYQILSYLESKGFRWQSGHLPTKWRSMDYLAEENFGFDVEKKKIWCNVGSYDTDLTNEFFASIREKEADKPVCVFPDKGQTFINISSEKEAAQLLNYLECKEYSWRSGSKPTEFQSTSFFIDKYIRINHDTKQLAYSGKLESNAEESKKFFEFIGNKANLIPDEPFYVTCNSKAEADIVLEALEAKGIKWHSGSKPTELPSKYNNLTYGIVRRRDGLGLGFDKSTDIEVNLTNLLLGDVRLLNKESTKKQNKSVSDTTKELQRIADALPKKWYVNTEDNNINLDLLFKVCDHLGINMASGANVRRFMSTCDSEYYTGLEFNADCKRPESIVVLDDGYEPDEDSTDVSKLFIDKQDTSKELEGKVKQIASKLPSKWYVVNSDINTELLIQVCEHLDINFNNGDKVRERFTEGEIDIEQVIEYGSYTCSKGLVQCHSVGEVDSDSEDVSHLFKEPALTKLSKDIHKANVERGWYKNSREDGTLIMLAVSELAEAMEGNRKDLMDDHLPHRKMEEVELADAVIRILDYAAYKGYDIGEALEEKLEYNKTRADHDLSERAKQSGKRY